MQKVDKLTNIFKVKNFDHSLLNRVSNSNLVRHFRPFHSVYIPGTPRNNTFINLHFTCLSESPNPLGYWALPWQFEAENRSTQT